MPDEQDRRLPDELPEEQPQDDDIPFHLPFSDDIEATQSDAPPPKPLWNADNPIDARNMPTMPIPREPGVPDPNKTLQGSGGLDPNPDFNTRPNADVGNTVQHKAVRLDNTMPHEPAPPHRNYNPPQQYQAPIYQQPSNIPPPPPVGNAAPVQPPRRRPAPRKKGFLGCSRGCLGLVAGFLAIFCGGLTLLTLGIGGAYASRVQQQLTQRVSEINNYQQFQSTFYLDRNGRQLYEVFGEGRRTRIDYSQFPQYLIDATVSIEDDSFFSNPGIDVQSTIRAFLQFVGLQEGSTGGSSITQQLVRGVLFDIDYRTERSVQRKLDEIGLALALNGQMTKEQILELYLNEIYYGNLAYGAEAAAQTFFGKNARDLTLGEAALLAGLPQAPAELDPLNNDPTVQDKVEARWRLVLERMVFLGKITQAQANEALAAGLNFVPRNISLEAPHFTVYAETQFEKLMADIGYQQKDVARGGFTIYTTLDLDINNAAQQAARNQVAQLAGNNVTNASVVVLKPLTGEILAMVGSVDYNNEAIDGSVNVSVSLRQPGSTMKPFNYAAAMENGMTAGDVIWDTPTSIGIPGQPQYVPRNYDGVFHGPMVMRYALANSYNIPAVQTLRRYGVAYLLGLMQRFGVGTLGDNADLYGLSLTLGGGEVSLLDLTNGYSVFANQGSYVPTAAILCVLDSSDNIIYNYENGCTTGVPTEKTVNKPAYGKQAVDPRIAFIISDILADNNARSTAMGANSPLNTGALGASVKTGTTNDVKDNWTVGYTRNVAVGVWVGNSNGDPMVNSSGLTGAAPIWNSVINTIYGNQALLQQDFAVNGQLQPDQQQSPGGISRREICDVRRLREPATDCARINEWFLDGPAGIPDPDGNLVFPPAPQPAQQDPNGVQLSEVSPGVFQVLAFRLAPEIASLIQFQVTPGQQPPPTPLYCQVPNSLASSAAGAQAQLFIAPPPVPDDAVAAENYARNNGLAFLPTITCAPDLLQGGGGGGYGPVVTTAIITSPQPGQVLSGETPIFGTVQFTADQGKFYKIEVIGGGLADWTTIGTTHTENIVNGQIENLYVPGLVAGSYRMRLVIVDNSGGFLQAPYEVPFTVAH
ncbi:MAG: transglycosylase domain-containing protein [Chloroflexi bacterium]|nr:transglycosylase domain-containing protein [Chloroflexota bacterium]MCC6893724.1 transglycosylase domain-containing protein [Anaerolineae bacterium]